MVKIKVVLLVRKPSNRYSSFVQGCEVPLTNTGDPWPLRNVLTCALRRKFYRCGPLPTPLVVMITKLSFIGIPKIASLSDWLQ